MGTTIVSELLFVDDSQNFPRDEKPLIKGRWKQRVFFLIGASNDSGLCMRKYLTL